MNNFATDPDHWLGSRNHFATAPDHESAFRDYFAPAPEHWLGSRDHFATATDHLLASSDHFATAPEHWSESTDNGLGYPGNFAWMLKEVCIPEGKERSSECFFAPIKSFFVRLLQIVS
jgi:hypothetical protein